MKRQGSVVRKLLNIGLCTAFGCSAFGLSSVALAADQGWIAPAPMGPYGGHFDFGIPESSEQGESANGVAMPQVEHAVYQQQDELPVIQASYATPQVITATMGQQQFSQQELERIDAAWSLEPESVEGGMQGDAQSDVWALGEIQPEKLPALVEQPAAVVAAAQSVSLEEAPLPPCSVQQPAGQPLLTSAHTPFQEAVLDEFEQNGVDMEAMADEADRLSQLEERRSGHWNQTKPPVYYPTYMPDYALGVRRADAMDPLALIPQMSSPVQYFGFQK